MIKEGLEKRYDNYKINFFIFIINDILESF